MATLIILAGLPGVGKTYAGKIIHNNINSYFFDSDKFAKKYLTGKLDDKTRFEFYIKKMNAVESLLKSHNVVIMDAVFDKNNLRKLFYEMIQKISGKLIILEVIAPYELAKARIEKDLSKERLGTPDSRLEMYEKMRKGWQPIRLPLFTRNFIKYYKINSSKDINPQINKILLKEKLIRG